MGLHSGFWSLCHPVTSRFDCPPANSRLDDNALLSYFGTLYVELTRFLKKLGQVRVQGQHHRTPSPCRTEICRRSSTDHPRRTDKSSSSTDHLAPITCRCEIDAVQGLFRTDPT